MGVVKAQLIEMDVQCFLVILRLWMEKKVLMSTVLAIEPARSKRGIIEAHAMLGGTAMLHCHTCTVTRGRVWRSTIVCLSKRTSLEQYKNCRLWLGR